MSLKEIPLSVTVSRQIISLFLCVRCASLVNAFKFFLGSRPCGDDENTSRLGAAPIQVLWFFNFETRNPRFEIFFHFHVRRPVLQSYKRSRKSKTKRDAWDLDPTCSHCLGSRSILPILPSKSYIAIMDESIYGQPEQEWKKGTFLFLTYVWFSCLDSEIQILCK